MRRVGDFEGGIQGHEARIHPVALVIEGSLAVGESGQLAVLGAVQQHVGIAVLEDQFNILAVLMEALGIHFAFQHLVDVGGIVPLVADSQIHVEVMQAGNPGHAGGRAGNHGDHHVEAQLSLHAVQLRESIGQGVEVGQGCGIDPGLVQDVLVVGQAVAFNSHGEADNLVAIHVGGRSVLGPLSAGLIGDLVLPELVAAGAFNDPDVGLTAGSHFGLQNGVVVGGSATGDDFHRNAGLLFIQFRKSFQLSGDLHLVLADHDISQRGSRSQHHGDCQHESNKFLHGVTSFYFSAVAKLFQNGFRRLEIQTTHAKGIVLLLFVKNGDRKRYQLQI